jgi:hypothetical protein
MATEKEKEKETGLCESIKYKINAQRKGLFQVRINQQFLIYIVRFMCAMFLRILLQMDFLGLGCSVDLDLQAGVEFCIVFPLSSAHLMLRR